MNTKYRFRKEERIAGKKDIERLFEAGESFKAFPFRVMFFIRSPRTTSIGSSVLISVSKKRFKHAVDRNRIKRLVRESYRLNTEELKSSLEGKNTDLLIAFLYIGREICEYAVIENSMKKALSVLNEKIAG